MPAKRKDDANDDAESINSSNGSASIKNSKRLRTSTSNLKQPATSQTSELAQELYDFLKAYRNAENRAIGDTFARLPPKRGNAEYYSSVKEPIDFAKIQQKIKADEYKSFNEFDSDLQLLIANAKAFYKKNSPEYKDAVGLHDAYEAEKKRKSLTKAGAKAKQEEEVEEDEDDDEEDEENDEDEEDEEEEEDEAEEKMELDDSASRARRGRSASAKGSPLKGVKSSSLNNSNDTDEPAAGNETERSTRLKSAPKHDLSIYLEDLFDIICSYQDPTQRYLALVFYLLPSAKVYPDYYEVIKKPIDLKTIGKKIRTSAYKNLKQMEADLVLMCDNAKRYNDPKSIIYKDATKLRKLAKDSAAELNSLMQQGKLVQSSKTREKKHKLVEEVSEYGEEEFNQMLEKQAKIVIKVEQQVVAAAATSAKTGVPPAQPTDDEDDDEDELDQTNSDNEASGGKTGTRKTSGLLALMWNLYEYAKDYKNGAQTLIDPFMKLPSKRIYPDYYEEIKKPIAMNMIKKSLSKRLYKSIKEMSDDLELMCTNAMQYNVEESVIYGNAKKLLEAVRQKASELSVVAASLPPESIVPKSPASTPKKAASNAAVLNKSGAKQQTKASLVEHNMKRLFKLVIEYCGGEEEAAGSKSGSNQTIPGGRANNKSMLSQHFMSLPSRELQPDYYEKIKDPLDFNTVRKRIESGVYSTEGDMVVDCVKVLENAKSYYSESSQFHKDAQKLKLYLNKKYQLFLNRQNFGVGDEAEVFSAPSSSTLLPKFNDLKDKLLFLYNYINDYQIDQRELAYPFRHLPSKTEYPDYYNVIKKPIDMTKIMNKINQLGHASYSYTSVDDMCVDFGQMFENACVYNEPTSTLYKDALNLQRALFLKRDEMVQHELSLTSSSYENFNETLHESLPVDFVSRAVHELVESLFDSCMQYQDMEGRVLSETFVDLYDLFDRMNSANILTFDMIQKRVKERVYKRMDVFQEEMFEVFNQIRSMSYYEALSSSDQHAWPQFNKHKINRFSQLYKDAYELQRYFIQKRDEVCRNGDLLQTGSLSFKLSSLDSHVSHVINSTPSFDEYDALLVEQRYQTLEAKLGPAENKPDQVQYPPGSFYYADRNSIKSGLIHKEMFTLNPNSSEELIICVLASDQTESKLAVQVYLKPTDDEFIEYEYKKTKKFFSKEVLKSDVYALIDIANAKLRPCLVIGVKEFISSEPVLAQDSPISSKEDIYVCESMYSTYFKYFRKLMSKKWSPLAFISTSAQAQTQPIESVTFSKRQLPLLLARAYLNEADVNALVAKINAYAQPTFKSFHRETIQYDSPPAIAKEKDADELEQAPAAPEEDPEIMKTAKYYEQLMHSNNEWYKPGDFVYVKYQANAANNHSSEEKLPMIVRIDRLWSTTSSTPSGSIVTNFYLRGPLFLRPIDIAHEPTRLFYRNEVFKEVSREITASLDQIVENPETGNKKCVVMSSKKFTTSRPTEINEADVYVCEAKYSLQLKTFRKLAKGLRKFELSLKCYEDEVYFLKRELQLKKHISPILRMMKINYDESSADLVGADEINGAMGSNQNEDYWAQVMHEDDASSQSFNDSNLDSSNIGSPMLSKTLKTSFMSTKTPDGVAGSSTKKIRVPRDKKSAYNIFSKEFRKRLRDTKSSLSFVNMSKEVGNRWRALSAKERAMYEEKARVESIKEQQRRAAEAKAAAELNASQPQAQNVPSSPHSNHINHILAVQAAQHQQPNGNGNQMYVNTSSNMMQTSSTGSPIIMNKQTPVLLYPNQVAQQQPVYVNAQQMTQNGYVQQVQQVVYEQQPQAPPPQPLPKPVETPRQVQHKAAYIKYIANLRKQQHLYEKGALNSVAAGLAMPGDWYNSIDIRANRIKEHKVNAPPSAWIESCASSDVLSHLLSLRYHLLNDAVSIQREPFGDVDGSSEVENNEGDEQEMQVEIAAEL